MMPLDRQTRQAYFRITLPRAVRTGSRDNGSADPYRLAPARDPAAADGGGGAAVLRDVAGAAQQLRHRAGRLYRRRDGHPAEPARDPRLPGLRWWSSCCCCGASRTLAYLLSLLVLGIGTAITGFFPSVIGLYCHHRRHVDRLSTITRPCRSRCPCSGSKRRRRRTPWAGSSPSAPSPRSPDLRPDLWLAFDLLGLDFKWVYLLGGGLTVGHRRQSPGLPFRAFRNTPSSTPHGAAPALLALLRCWCSCPVPGGRSSSSSPASSWSRSSATTVGDDHAAVPAQRA